MKKTMKTLYVKKGMCLDTPNGYQKIIDKHISDTCYIVHNYDGNGIYTGASYLTDREVARKYYDMTGKFYDFVMMEE